MDTFLELPATERRLAFQQVESTMGLQAVSVEKDFWVCWTLRELHRMPGVGDNLTFKGGTSLSKVWKVIQRFSEDIDLIVDKNALGFGGEAAPERAPSNKQRRARLEKLMDTCRDWVQQTLQPALAVRLHTNLGGGGLEVGRGPRHAGRAVPSVPLSIRLPAECRRICAPRREDGVRRPVR